MKRKLMMSSFCLLLLFSSTSLAIFGQNKKADWLNNISDQLASTSLLENSASIKAETAASSMTGSDDFVAGAFVQGMHGNFQSYPTWSSQRHNWQMRHMNWRFEQFRLQRRLWDMQALNQRKAFQWRIRSLELQRKSQQAIRNIYNSQMRLAADLASRGVYGSLSNAARMRSSLFSHGRRAVRKFSQNTISQTRLLSEHRTHQARLRISSQRGIEKIRYQHTQIIQKNYQKSWNQKSYQLSQTYKYNMTKINDRIRIRSNYHKPFPANYGFTARMQKIRTNYQRIQTKLYNLRSRYGF